MKRVLHSLSWLLRNFSPLIVFYAANHFFGLKPAIALSMFFSIAGFLRAKIFREKTSTFFKFSAAIAVSFGIVDLFLKDSFLFKYEAAVTNFIRDYFLLPQSSPTSLSFKNSTKGERGLNIPLNLNWFDFFEASLWFGSSISSSKQRSMFG